MLIGMAAVECFYKEAVGAVMGFVGLFVYLGVLFVGWLLVKVFDIWYWSGFFVVIFIVVGIFVLLLLFFLNV